MRAAGQCAPSCRQARSRSRGGGAMAKATLPAGRGRREDCPLRPRAHERRDRPTPSWPAPGPRPIGAKSSVTGGLQRRSPSWPGLSRPSTRSCKKCTRVNNNNVLYGLLTRVVDFRDTSKWNRVDGRDKPGHDGQGICASENLNPDAYAPRPPRRIPRQVETVCKTLRASPSPT